MIVISGTRPQLIKAIWFRDRLSNHFPEPIKVVHFGQHFSPEMLDHDGGADVTVPLDSVEGMGEGEIIGAISSSIVEHIVDGAGLVDWPIIVIGDCTTTLAAALWLQQNDIDFVHLEAGPRCRESKVEGIICAAVDHMALYNFCPTEEARANLEKEGIPASFNFFTGDIMLDSWLWHRNHIESGSLMIEGLEVSPDRGTDVLPNIIVTMHRSQNVDNSICLKAWWAALKELGGRLSSTERMGFVLHPRLENRLRIEALYHICSEKMIYLPPQPYSVMHRLVREAELVITDSGGLQREAFWAGTKCLIMREATEWPQIATSSIGGLVRPAGLANMAMRALEHGLALDLHRPQSEEERHALFGGRDVIGRMAEALERICR